MYVRVYPSHTLRGCVDWNTEGRGTAEFLYRHTLRGCVDWNPHDLKRTGVIAVTPCVGVWIETFLDLLLSYSRGHTLRGCVDWNFIRMIHNNQQEVTPCVGVWIETIF